MKRYVFVLLVILLCVMSCISVSAEGTELPDLSRVQNVYIYNMENDCVLYSKNETTRIYPASTAKLMTGVIAVEFYEGDTDGYVTVTEEALGNWKGKNIKLKVGEVLTVNDLIYATVVGGANDAANVLAYEIAGTHQDFLDAMNHKAKELGMTNTYYTSAFGYSDPDMYTTAEDVMKLAKYAYLVEGFMDICSTVRYTVPETNTSNQRYVYNSSSLVSTFADVRYRNTSAMGMNAGSTVEGGYVVVTAVAKEGMTNLYVLMGGGYDDRQNYAYRAANQMIKWSFDNYSYRYILNSGEMVSEIPVRLSSQVDYVVLSPVESVQYFLPHNVDINSEIAKEIELYYEDLEAPFEAGFVAGMVTLRYKGEIIAEVELVTKNNVDRNGFLYILARIKSFTESPKFQIVIICVLIVAFLYVGISIYKLTLGKRYRYKYQDPKK